MLKVYIIHIHIPFVILNEMQEKKLHVAHSIS